MEGKDSPNEGPSDESKFVHKFGSKITELAVKIVGTLGRYVIDDRMNSGLGYVTSVVQIKRR